MTVSYKDMVAAARARIRVVSPAEAAAMPGATILDVREPAEVEAGRIGGPFLGIPRGWVEPRACPESGLGDPALIAAKSGPVCVLCAAGGRAALAAAALADMGYDALLIEGGFRAWKEAGLPVG